MKKMKIYEDIYYFYFPVDYYGGFYYCIEVKKFGDSYKVISVSYTHLDVYKRQVLYGAAGQTGAPTLTLTYDTSYGTGGSYQSQTHRLGRFGAGSVDLQSGNLTFLSLIHI